jgi:twitching motility protein PilT
MQSFDQSLMSLVKQELVSYEEALKHVSNADDFALRFRGIASTSDGTWDDFEKDEEEGEQPSAGAAGEDRSDGAKPEGDIDIERF